MKKSKKNTSAFRNLLLGGLVIGGAVLGTMWITDKDASTGQIIIDSSQEIYEKADVTFKMFDMNTEDELLGLQVYVTDEFGVEIGTFETGSAIADTFYHAGTYKGIVLDNATYGSDVTIKDGAKGLKAIGEDFEFTIESKNGMVAKLEVEKVSTMDLKVYNNDAGTEAFIGGSDAYTSSNSVIVDANATTGSLIDTAGEVLDQMVTLKAVDRDANANIDGQLIVIDSDDDEWEKFVVTADGKTLTKLTEDELENNYAKVTFDEFLGKDVYLLSEDVDMPRNSEVELNFFSEMRSGATISTDVNVKIYSLGNIETADGVELSALKSDSSDLRTPKSITFNLI